MYVPGAGRDLIADEEVMTDPQIMTLATAIVIPLSMLIVSTSRITVAKETLRAEIAAGCAGMFTEIQSLNADLKIHELEHHHK